MALATALPLCPARLAVPRRPARRSPLRPCAALRPAQVDGLIGIGLTAGGLCATSAVFTHASSFAPLLGTVAASLTPSVPLASTVLVCSLVVLERSSIAAALASGAGDVLRLLGLGAALAGGVAALAFSQVPLLKMTLSHPNVTSLFTPSLPLAAALLLAGLLCIERASVTASLAAALPRLPDVTAVALLLLLAIRGATGPGAELLAKQRAAAALRAEAALVAAAAVPAPLEAAVGEPAAGVEAVATTQSPA